MSITPSRHAWGLLVILGLGGCAGLEPRAASVSGPVLVRAQHDEAAWERCVDVLHSYLFEIERENKFDGVIETKYKTGAGLLEPWHADSADLPNRLESTLQSIRRKVLLRISRNGDSYAVQVEAYKEIEDVAKTANSPGPATFLDNNALRKDMAPVIGQSTPSGWVSLGRDSALEQSLSQALQVAFAG